MCEPRAPPAFTPRPPTAGASEAALDGPGQTRPALDAVLPTSIHTLRPPGPASGRPVPAVDVPPPADAAGRSGVATSLSARVTAAASGRPGALGGAKGRGVGGRGGSRRTTRGAGGGGQAWGRQGWTRPLPAPDVSRLRSGAGDLDRGLTRRSGNASTVRHSKLLKRPFHLRSAHNGQTDPHVGRDRQDSRIFRGRRQQSQTHVHELGARPHTCDGTLGKMPIPSPPSLTNSFLGLQDNIDGNSGTRGRGPGVWSSDLRTTTHWDIGF